MPTEKEIKEAKAKAQAVAKAEAEIKAKAKAEVEKKAKAQAELNKDAIGFKINPKGTKYVGVKALKTHKCEICKVPYNFVKGERYRISEFALLALEEAGIVA